MQREQRLGCCAPSIGLAFAAATDLPRSTSLTAPQEKLRRGQRPETAPGPRMRLRSDLDRCHDRESTMNNHHIEARRSPQRRLVAAAIAALLVVDVSGAGERSFLPSMLPFANPSGLSATVSSKGEIDVTGPFFQDL